MSNRRTTREIKLLPPSSTTTASNGFHLSLRNQVTRIVSTPIRILIQTSSHLTRICATINRQICPYIIRGTRTTISLIPRSNNPILQRSIKICITIITKRYNIRRRNSGKPKRIIIPIAIPITSIYTPPIPRMIPAGIRKITPNNTTTTRHTRIRLLQHPTTRSILIELNRQTIIIQIRYSNTATSPTINASRPNKWIRISVFRWILRGQHSK